MQRTLPCPDSSPLAKVTSVAGHPLPTIDQLHERTGLRAADVERYLRGHYPRFESTWQTYATGPFGERRGHLIDIGSHWLHQTLIWRLQGFEVTAVDVPATIDTDVVRGIAARERLELCSNTNLENPDGLAALPSDCADVILMSEVIEHLTFNPLTLWRTLYRLLKPGGVLVVTTPNYYALRGRAWNLGRFLTGRGGGLTVDEILRINTFGHHWREFAAAELRDYFTLLSSDFRIVRLLRLPRSYRNSTKGWIATGIERLLPFLRDQIYLEVALPEKHAGITMEASW